MDKADYFKSLGDTAPGEQCYTQLEKWSLSNDGNNLSYLGEYVSKQTIEKLEEANKGEIIDLLLKTHYIPVRIDEGKNLSLEGEYIDKISQYLILIQERLMVNFDLMGRSMTYYKDNIDDQCEILKQEYVTITGAGDANTMRLFYVLLYKIQNIINEDFTDKINNYGEGYEYQIQLQISKIRETIETFFSTNLSTIQLSALYINANIPNLMKNIESYIYESYHQYEEDKMEKIKKLEEELAQAIEKEDYIKASAIRDEIKKLGGEAK